MSRNGAESRAAFVAAHAGGQTVTVAARTAGIGRRTAGRWLKEPTFAAEIRAARAALLEGALGRLAGAAEAAVTTLADLLRSESPTVQLGAARAILEALVRVREHVEVAERLAALEARLGATAETEER